MDFLEVESVTNPKKKNLLLVEEIRRSPVDFGGLSHYLQGSFTSQVVIAGFLNHHKCSLGHSPHLPW